MDTTKAVDTESATGTLASNTLLHARERRVSVDEYHRMADAGILTRDDRVELLSGRIITLSPIGASHFHVVNALEEAFARRLYTSDAPAARISVQNPIRLNDFSEPEPDVVLYRPDVPRDRIPTPEDVLLVVEVADTTVEYDRTVKAAAYADAGLPEYWLVDVSRAAVDVYREPDGATYAERIRHRSGDALSVAALPALDPVDVGAVLGETE